MKKNVIRCISCVLLLFSISFGATKKNSGFCIGDNIFIYFGIEPWSNGYEGIHYPGVIAIVGVFTAVAVYALTTENKLRTLRRLLIGMMVLWAILNIRPVFSFV